MPFLPAGDLPDPGSNVSCIGGQILEHCAAWEACASAQPLGHAVAPGRTARSWPPAPLDPGTPRMGPFTGHILLSLGEPAGSCAHSHPHPSAPRGQGPPPTLADFLPPFQP